MLNMAEVGETPSNNQKTTAFEKNKGIDYHAERARLVENALAHCDRFDEIVATACSQDRSFVEEGKQGLLRLRSIAGNAAGSREPGANKVTDINEQNLSAISHEMKRFLDISASLSRSGKLRGKIEPLLKETPSELDLETARQKLIHIIDTFKKTVDQLNYTRDGQHSAEKGILENIRETDEGVQRTTVRLRVLGVHVSEEGFLIQYSRSLRNLYRKLSENTLSTRGGRDKRFLEAAYNTFYDFSTSVNSLISLRQHETQSKTEQ